MAHSSWLQKMIGSDLKLDSLEDLLCMQLDDLYSAETQLIAALPKMEAAASSPHLKTAFRTHLQETRVHKDRLEQVFKTLGYEKSGETCEAMQGLVEEGSEIISINGDPEVKDAALIAAAQRVEHYEIAGYGCVRNFARRLGREDVASILQQTLDEEGKTDKLLTQIADSSVNVQAARA